VRSNRVGNIVYRVSTATSSWPFGRGRRHRAQIKKKKPRVSIRTELFISRRKNSAPGVLSATDKRHCVHSVVNNITSAKRRKKCTPNNTTTRYTRYYFYTYICARVCTLLTNTCKRLTEIVAEIDWRPRSASTQISINVYFIYIYIYVYWNIMLYSFFIPLRGYQSCVYYYFFLSVTMHRRGTVKRRYICLPTRPGRTAVVT